MGKMTRPHSAGLQRRTPFETSRSSLYDRLLVYWRLDDENADHGGAGFDLTLVNSPTWVEGKVGNAVSLNGSDQYLSLADGDLGALSQDGSSDFTLSAWIKPTNLTGVRVVASIQGSDNADKEWRWGTSGANIYFTLYEEDAEYRNTAAQALTINVWQHVVVWFDTTDMKARLSHNGAAEKVGVAVTEINQGGAPFKIGMYASTSGDWIGQIDEFGFWTRMLTAAERAMLHQSGTGKRFPF